MSETDKKNSGIVFSAVAGIIVLTLFVGISYWLYLGRQAQTKRNQVPDIVEFSSIPSDAKIEASIDLNGKPQPISVVDGHLVLSAEQQQNFHLPYVLRATVHLADGTYHDFWWDVGRNGADYYMGAAGFSPEDRARLFINNIPSGDVPFDWAGRIEFASILIVAETQKNCIYTERKNGERIGACHYTSGKS